MRSLEDALLEIPCLIVHNGVLDVELSNAAIISYAKKNRLRPVVVEGTAVYYRSIERSSDGLLRITYSEMPPGYIEPLYGSERIRLELASKALGVSKKELMKKLRKRQLKAKSNWFTLSALNSAGR